MREGLGKVAPLDSLPGQDNTDFLPRKSSVHTDTDKPGEISELSSTRLIFNPTQLSLVSVFFSALYMPCTKTCCNVIPGNVLAETTCPV